MDDVEYFREEMMTQAEFMDNIHTFMGEERAGKKKKKRR